MSYVPVSNWSCPGCSKTELNSGGRKFKSCGACKTTFYCSTTCQKQDWKRHKPSCRSFVAVHNKMERAAMSAPKDAALYVALNEFIMTPVFDFILNFLLHAPVTRRDTRPRWLALESNPESYNRWASNLGLDTTKWSFQECYGLDPEALSWVSTPVKAVIALVPAYYELRKLESPDVEKDGLGQLGMDGVLWFPQKIGNACGTFALLHAFANAGVPLDTSSPLLPLYAKARTVPTAERSAILESSSALAATHIEAASAGTQTTLPPIEAKVDHHFVAFVEWDGWLVELDGARSGVLRRGRIEKGLLEDTAEVIRGLAALSDSIEFNLVALCPA
ncbi:hypothetical protein RQP46_010826 [Phenoliferia psychrophenolica]